MLGWRAALVVAIGTALLLALAPARLSAQIGEGDKAVEAGRDALRDSATFPWYDRENDSLRRLELPVAPEPYESPVDPGNRNSDWQKTPSAPAAPKATPTGGGAAAPGMGLAGEMLLWMVLILVIVVVVAMLCWAFLRSEERKPQQDGDSQKRGGSSSRLVDRVEDLPFTLNRPRDNLLEEARRCYEQGNFSDAAVYLFSYQLLQLDRNQLIRLARGKTNRQYVRELRQRPDLAMMLQGTMRLFEDAFFGRREILRDQFETSWNRLDAFHRQVQESVV
ncbi:DUF4129 domain-containing protein [Lignipirellula cremea]|uniref:Protein-glutamine gamma-glutamyltransferase-like C-terminal domain-containing protein n=1 Tax=Lignipirellula cremea TaxID=2528010 RepID=A0A518DX59_9BACT|nr:DUF4129 domain-containing protein [Lignipirellula cremea]QDU96448.1 hypothetical protein Pla8534_42690 [Lignipirellula cremea]